MIRSLSPLLSVLFFSSSLIAQSLPFAKVHTYQAGSYNSGATKYISFDHTVQQLYSINQGALGFDIIDYSDVFKPNVKQTVDVSSFMNHIRSIETSGGDVFVAGDGSSPQLPGKLLIYNSNGVYRKQLSLGVTPDRMKFSPDDITLIIANEGIPDSAYSTDPPGTINVINTSAGVNFITQADVKTVDFTLLDTVAYDSLIHVYDNAGQSPSQDLEPEAIAITSNGQKAIIAIQENNALAVIDIQTASLDEVLGMGYRDYNLEGLDASDLSKNINIDTHQRLYGIHQPSDIEAFNHMGAEYVLTANQGAPREYAGYDETVRVKNQPVDPSKFSNLSSLLEDTILGRLRVTSAFGDHNGDFLHDSLLAFGSRSISIWDSTGTEVWNSGDYIPQVIALLHAANFSSSAVDNSSYKTRSDDMGIEPSTIAVGEIDGKRYAFVGLYQMGGIFIYDITDPLNPVFELYELNRDFSFPASDPMAGDLGPTDLEFVPATKTNLGIALLFVANEVSGSISVYQAGIGVGIDEHSQSDSKSIYPNPSEGIFYTGQKADYKVFDQSGSLIREVHKSDRIDISDQPTGLYMIIHADGSSIKVVKR